MAVWSSHLLFIGQNLKLVFFLTVVTSQLLMHCNYMVLQKALLGSDYWWGDVEDTPPKYVIVW